MTPFRLGNKNDYNDAQAIAEAASRPQMRFVATKYIDAPPYEGAISQTTYCVG